MKKILIVASVILFLCGCSKMAFTPKGRAKNIIKEHIKEYINDPKSYDPINFSELFVDKDGTTYMIHRFRASNNFGATVKHIFFYYFDKEIREVLGSEEVDEDWIEMATLGIELGREHNDPLLLYEWVIEELNE